jgi:ketosteroid isomerase-like protein
MLASTLPTPVAIFVDALNRHDLEALVATFAPDALVNDHRCEFRGAGAIRDWAAREIVGDRVTMNVIEATRRGDGASVSAAIDGAFPKAGLPSPFVLGFYFTTDRDRIALLVIVHNAPKAAAATGALETNRQVVRTFFDRFAAGDIDGTVALFADDATYWFPTTRKVLPKPELAEGLRWIQSRLDGPIRFEIGPMVAEGNKVAVQVESFATTVEGKRFNNLYHLYFEIEGGRIQRAREYNDTAHVYDTLRAGQRREGA